MVQDTRKTLRADTHRSVNLPEPIEVKEDSSGLPLAVKTLRQQVVAAIEENWRIDDEWWRRTPVSRLYFSVRLDSGHRLVFYKDLTDNCWYKQSY
ncbi:hypothetical protein ACFLU1_02875 [Chloroflexota bacterium]